MRVPLILAAPGLAPAVRSDAVTIVDLAPTLLPRAGLAVAPGMQGLDLLRAPHERESYAETRYPETAGWSPLTALTDGRLKIIDGGDAELYDLGADEAESRNLAGARANTVEAMRARLQAIATAGGTGVAAPTVTPDVAERLRSLGYVASAPGPSARTRPGPSPARTIGDWVRFEDALAALDGDARLALPLLTSLAEAHPDARVFQATYARALLDLGRGKEALAVYRRVAARWPGDAATLHDLAVAAAESGALDEALRAEQAALALDPDYAAAHNGLGLLAARAGRPADARRAFEAAAHHDATNAQYLSNLGNACREVGDATASERAYRGALALDPLAPDALNGLAVVLVEADRPAEAIALLERATREDQDLYEAWLNLGIAYQQAGRVAEARQTYAHVLAAPARFARQRKAAADLMRSLAAH